MHQRIEGVRDRKVGNGTVQTSVFICNIGGLRTKADVMLRWRQWLERHAAGAVILVVRRYK